MNAGERNLAAEVRAIEAGHLCRMQDDGTFLVTSDTKHGKAYRVRTLKCYAGDTVTFCCEPVGNESYKDDHFKMQRTGVVTCMHTALLARRLERAGLIFLAADGQWTATDKSPAFAPDEKALDDFFNQFA